MNTLIELYEQLTDQQLMNMAQKRPVTVSRLRQVEEIPTSGIVFMGLAPDGNGRPKMLMIHQAEDDITVYNFPLYEGFQVHLCNEYLRGLETDISVDFVTYRQYASLIQEVYQAISQ